MIGFASALSSAVGSRAVDRPVGDSQIRRMRAWHAHCEGILVHSHVVFRALDGLHKCFRDLGAEDPIKIPTV